MTDFTPTLDEFRRLAAGPATLIPVYREFAADLETPVSVYIKLMDEPGASFLLESVEGGEQVGRYSFVGVDPRAQMALDGRTVTTTTEHDATSRPLAAGEDFLDVLRAEMGRHTPADLPGLPRFNGGAVGYFGYDVVRFFERLPETAERVLDIPDAIFLLADTLVVFDHARHRLILLANADLTAATSRRPMSRPSGASTIWPSGCYGHCPPSPAAAGARRTATAWRSSRT
jgi:anthranilate synthase component 1